MKNTHCFLLTSKWPLNYLQRLHIFPQTLQDHEVQLDLERPMENES